MILILIDFDGVIIDTKEKSYQIFNRCLKKIQKCKNVGLINKLYNKADGLSLLSISKLLAKFFKTNNKKFYKFLKNEWVIAYKKTKLDNSILDFFYFINNLDAKIIIFSSSDFNLINKVLNKKLEKYELIKKKFNRDLILSKKVIKKINKLQTQAEYSINIDDNASINTQLTKINFTSINYKIHKTNKKLVEIFIATLFKKKINFFYNLKNLKNINFYSTKFKLTRKESDLVERKSEFKSFLNEKLCFLKRIKFINKKWKIFTFNDYYKLRFINKYISLAVQSIVIFGNDNFLIGKRKKVISEKNFFEFFPAGGLCSISKKKIYSQILNEFTEELNFKTSKKKLYFIGFYIDFKQNLLDFVFKIKMKATNKFNLNIRTSDEHSNFFIKKKTFIKNNYLLFTNSSKKIIDKMI